MNFLKKATLKKDDLKKWIKLRMTTSVLYFILAKRILTTISPKAMNSLNFF